MNKRKIMLLVAMLSMVAILGIGGTLAYFTAEDSVDNVFTIGNVDIDLQEPNWDSSGSKDAEDAYPGEPLAKDPKVVNVGANPCFVRIKVEGLDQYMEAYAPEKDNQGEAWGDRAMIQTRYLYENAFNDDEWELWEDGYYYYWVEAEDVRSGVLAAGTETGVLFDQIVLPFCIENDEEAVAVVVKAEAVQAQGARASFSAVKAMTVAEIAEWFGTAFSAAEVE